MIEIKRHPLVLRPNASRVLIRPFLAKDSDVRVTRILGRILSLNEQEVVAQVAKVLQEFGGRHKQITRVFQQRFAEIEASIPMDSTLSEDRKMLIGSYFTSEYSFESAALFNPGIVAAPDQKDVEPGGVRFILSLRATGEGHISSINFRSGILTASGEILLEPCTQFVTEPQPLLNPSYEKALFARKLAELGQEGPATDEILHSLGELFSFDELKASISKARRMSPRQDSILAGQRMLLLAKSNYDVVFDCSQSLSERVIFPYGPTETNGIEDARFTRFIEDDGTPVFHATYTAYDGQIVLPQILTTEDFCQFSIRTLNGPAVANKGMALFPRKLGGLYCMLARQDNENIHLMYSEHLHFWHESRVIVRPREPWEFVKMGNCGPPIETEAGWLVLTHGVGPMRRYCIGAILLDLEDPTKLIGRLREPLIQPEPHEREGYVPNVVYTCGALCHQGQLLIPYAVSDSATTFATANLSDLLSALKSP